MTLRERDAASERASQEDDRLAAKLEPFLTPKNVAETLQLETGVYGVYELARPRARDPLPVMKIGKYLRIPRREFVAWLERQRVRR
jgi:hypothetical protein